MNTAPMRILLVLNLPWDRRLGATRVFVELAEQWRKAGHTVDTFCLSDAFTHTSTHPALIALQQMLFARRARRRLRHVARNYDVIDALIGTVPYAKSELAFHGLLVARSVGLHRTYEKFGALARIRWPDQPRGKFLGRLFYRYVSQRMRRAAEGSIRHADLVNLPNTDERAAFIGDAPTQTAALVQPYGLTPEFLTALAQSRTPEALCRRETPVTTFIGMWGIRKGARDWGEIIRRIRAEGPRRALPPAWHPDGRRKSFP